MSQTHIRTDIQRALTQFTDENLAENATRLLSYNDEPHQFTDTDKRKSRISNRY